MTRTSKVRRIVVVGLLTAGTFAGLAPANAADTVTTFSLAGTGALNISVPTGTAGTPKALGSTTAGSATYAAASGTFGTVTVTDSRTGLLNLNNWTATVSSTDFITGTGAAATEKVLSAAISYTGGTGTYGSGTATTHTFTPGVAVTLGAPGVAGAEVANGTNSESWSPALTFTLSPLQVAGTYTGTITHSVA